MLSGGCSFCCPYNLKLRLTLIDGLCISRLCNFALFFLYNLFRTILIARIAMEIIDICCRMKNLYFFLILWQSLAPKLHAKNSEIHVIEHHSFYDTDTPKAKVNLWSGEEGTSPRDMLGIIRNCNQGKLKHGCSTNSIINSFS